MCLLALPANAKYSGGTGEPNDPYQIATAADLIALGETPNDYNKHFILTADIDLDPNLPGRKVFDKAVIAAGELFVYPSTWVSWYEGTAFTGVFDGHGHTILHLAINGGDYLGLFGAMASEAEIKNLGLEAANIIGAGRNIGGLVGWNSGSIATSYSTGSVSGNSLVGGLVGANGGNISASCSSGSVSGTGTSVGGLAGSSSGRVTNSYSTGWVSGDLSVGGLVGSNSGSITASCSSGSVSGTTCVGGLVGWNRGPVTYSYSTGTVDGGNSVGGLVGSNRGDFSLEGVMYCYSTGVVHGDSSVGGLVGSGRPVSVRASFWDIGTSGQAKSAGGTGLATAQMQAANTFVTSGWGTCGSFWTINDGLGYPHLSWEGMPGDRVGVATYGGGNGTSDDPYLICTAEQLNMIGAIVCNWDKHFKLMADIDLSDFDGKDGRPAFNTIGEYGLCDLDDDPMNCRLGPPFTGVFDGNGHVISHLTIRGQHDVALFVRLAGGAEVKDLGIVDVNVIATGGGIAGGLVGYNEDGLVLRCYSTGVVCGGYYVGGLVGVNGHRIMTSYSATSVSGTGGFVGGLVGSNWGGTIATSYSTGTVSGNDDVGGLVGENWCGSISASHSSASVSGTGWAVGGLVGSNNGSIATSYSSGSVSGDRYVGGLVGSGEATLVTVSFWDILTSKQSTSAGGTGKTTAEMQSMETFLSAGWDFVGEVINGTCDSWEIRPGEYPRLHYHAGNRPSMPEGLGTAEQPYLIRDARDLGTVWSEPLAHYRLAHSIDLAGIKWSMAVIPWFGGSFEGDGHVIRNLHVEGGAYLGLFGELGSTASVLNLHLQAVEVIGRGDCVGGLAGSSAGKITSSYSTGSVTGTGICVGGLVGRNSWRTGTIASSYSTGAVSGQGYVGGLVGSNDGSIATSYSTGSVSGTGVVGGLVGSNWGGTIATSYSTALVSGHLYVGGLVGSGSPSAISGFWDTQTSGQNASAGGTGKTTAEMQDIETFLCAGWDFVGETANGTEDIWWILEGKDYPRLWWELPSEN
jgi:hypothetical protein